MSGHGSNQAGFTLVEVLAALGVFSIAAMGLVHVSTENTRTATIIETRALAAIVADNKLTETFTQAGNLVAGFKSSTTNLAGREWVVNETIIETETAGLLRIQIDVLEAETGQSGSASGVQRIAFRGARR